MNKPASFDSAGGPFLFFPLTIETAPHIHTGFQFRQPTFTQGAGMSLFCFIFCTNHLALFCSPASTSSSAEADNLAKLVS